MRAYSACTRVSCSGSSDLLYSYDSNRLQLFPPLQRGLLFLLLLLPCQIYCSHVLPHAQRYSAAARAPRPTYDYAQLPHTPYTSGVTSVIFIFAQSVPDSVIFIRPRRTIVVLRRRRAIIYTSFETYNNIGLKFISLKHENYV